MANGGLFITLYDDKSLALYLKYGLYGFLMKPIISDNLSAHSKHYAALADYACCREGTHVFFFLKRKIIYGGTIVGNSNIASFYINGDTSPLGRIAKAPLCWDESRRYEKTKKDGVFIVNEKEKSQPFIIKFDTDNKLSRKMISTDELYYNLSKFPYPLPSIVIQGMSFCTLTPGETDIALSLLGNSEKIYDTTSEETINFSNNILPFKTKYLSYQDYVNEAHIEYTILADPSILNNIISNEKYILCRQVPICPYKPYNIDRADICLYSTDNKLGQGTIPNIIIELKKDIAKNDAYLQVVRYLSWLEKITDEQEFKNIKALIIAPKFKISRNKINTQYENKIKLYILDDMKQYFIEK